MPDQVLRFQSRDKSALGGRLSAHVLGDSRPETALARDGLQPVQLLWGGHNELKEAAEFVAKTPRHHRAAPAVEALIAGPPPYKDDAAWSNKAVDAWGKDTVEWLRKMLAHSILYAAVLHTDEGAPHVHCLFVPRTAAGEISWRKANAEAFGREPPKNPQALSAIGQAWQDSYYAEVGKHHGLGRGKKGSTRRHTAIDRSKAAEMRAEEAEKMARRAAQEGLELARQVRRLVAGAAAAICKPWLQMEALVERLIRQGEWLRNEAQEDRRAANAAWSAAKQSDPDAVYEWGLNAGIASATDAAEDWAYEELGDDAQLFARSAIEEAAYLNAPDRKAAARKLECEADASAAAGRVGAAWNTESGQGGAPAP